MLLDKLLSNLAVHVEPFALCQVSKGWRIQLPGPREVMLHFVLMGEGVVHGTDGARQEMGPNWLAVVPRGLKHTLEWKGEVSHEETIEAPPVGSPVCRIVAGPVDSPDLLVACGAIRVRYGQSMGLFDYLRDILVIDFNEAPPVRGDFEGILAEQSELGPGSGTMTAALMTHCLVHVFRALAVDDKCPLPWLSALADARLSKALDRMLESPGEDHTVESLAEAASMSRSAFAEKFSASFGKSPMHMLHHVRMQHAARLLDTSPDLSIDDVAGRIGFASRSHFSRAFKKHCGVSPAAYRTHQ